MFLKCKNLSSKSDGNFWQSEFLCCRENPFLCIIHTHHPVLALNSCYAIFTGSIFVISHAMSVMMSYETGLAFDCVHTEQLVLELYESDDVLGHSTIFV
jgi:hypothetical protein